MDELSAKEIREYFQLAKPVFDPLISTFITPKLNKLSAWLKKEEIKIEVSDNIFENKFAEYLKRTLEKCQQINILIFPGLQIKLQEIYQPLTIHCRLTASSQKNKRTLSNTVYKVDDFDVDILQIYKKVLISDSAGMGKSTLSKWICLRTLEKSLAIPVLIELRNLKENHTVLDEIFDQLNPIDQIFNKDLILKFLELGHFLIILDGFDELPNENQEQIIKKLRSFIDKTPSNWFVMTSRPEGALTAFGDFQLFNIRPLKLEEAFELIRKYDAVSPVKIGENLIKNISTKLNQVQELLSNPFLVSLLYSVYAFNKDIPDDKVTFYEEIYSALYKKHDLSKDGWTRPKKSKLSLLQFRILLRQLAFDTALRGEITYSESEIINFIEEAKAKCPGISTNSEDFLDDLLRAVPLFQRDGHKIKWGHKSIQDFFASDYINYSAKKEEILNWIIKNNHDGFLNILDFYIEQDFYTFRKIVIYKLLKEFIHHFENSYLNIKGISQHEIDLRRTLTFDFNLVFTTDRSKIEPSKLKEFALREIPSYESGEKSGFFSHLPYKLLPLVISSLKTEILVQMGNKLPTNNYLLFRSTKHELRDLKLKLSSKQIYSVDDKPDNPLNSKANFSEVNELLRQVGPYNEAHLSYPEAKIELLKIEHEIEKEQKVNALDDFFKTI